MKISRFEDLLVWQKSRSLTVAIYQITGAGRFSRDYGLRDQVRRASVSVMSNIAEGFGRYGRTEMRRFVTIARGSVVASDAFFPFADGLLAAAEAGATAAIQPGGSVRDDEVIRAADEAGLAMVFTGVRHFRH